MTCCISDCPFTLPSTPIYKLAHRNGEEYCIFHLPLNEQFFAHPFKGRLLMKNEFPDGLCSIFQQELKQYLKERCFTFDQVVFPTSVSISGHQIDKLDFSNSTFLKPLYLSKLRVDSLSFRNTNFLYFDGDPFVMELSDISFGSSIDFEGANFGGCSLYLNSIKQKSSLVNQFAIEDGWKEKDGIRFSKCSYRDGVIIVKDVKLEGRLEFNAISGAGPSSINLLGLDVESIYIGTEGLKEDDRNLKTTFSFRDVNCRKNFMMINVNCRSFINFSTVMFGQAPKLDGTKLQADSSFPSESHFKDRSSLQAPARYRYLRLMMEEQRNRLDEGMFFALEQESLLNIRDEGKVRRFFTLSNWYRILTGYGQKPGQGAWWFVGLFALASSLYSWMASSCWKIWEQKCSVDIDIATRSAAFGLKQIVSPFSAWRSTEPLDEMVDSELALQILASFQSAGQITLGALILLAIRWKFKRG